MLVDKLSVRFVFVVLLTTLCGSFQFFTDSSINEVGPVIQDWMRSCYLKRSNTSLSDSTVTMLYSLATSSTLIGAIVGSVVLPFLAEGFGRRNGIVFGGIIGTLGSLAAGTSRLTNSPEQLIVGRLLQGFNTGIVSGLVPMYLTESSPIEVRGAAAAVHQFFVALGDTLALIVGIPQILGTARLWPVIVSLSGFLSLTLCILLPFCPESPRYLLLSKKQPQKAERAARFFSTPEEFPWVMASLREEKAMLENSGMKTITLKDKTKLIFSVTELRIPMMICLLIMLGQQGTGIVAVFNYSTTMFSNAGLTLEQARYSTMGAAGTYFIATLVAVFLIERLGRRPLLIAQYSGCVICLCLLSVCASQQDNGDGWHYLSIIVLLVYLCVYGIGSSIAWIIASELFNQKFRSAAVSLAVATSWTLSALVSLVYLPYQQAVGTAMSFIPFIIVLAVVLLCILLILPETKGRTVDEIIQDFKTRQHTLSAASEKHHTEAVRLVKEHSKGYGSQEPLLAHHPRNS